MYFQNVPAASSGASVNTKYPVNKDVKQHSSTNIRPAPPVYHGHSPVSMVRSLGMSTPTATVQPTLLNMKQTAVVGTVSPVRPGSYQYPNMFPAYNQQSQYPGQYYPYQSGNYSPQSYPAAKTDQFTPVNTPPAGGYFLAPASSPSYPGQVMTPVTTAAGQAGFICGPYNYPANYTPGRVIGPIIAIGN